MKLLCISRKHPPSVGGMQVMNYELISRLSRNTDAVVIAWGRSQVFLPIFIAWAFLRSLALLPRRRRPDAIYLGDALLAPLGCVLKLILRRPVAVTAHGLDLTFRFPLYRTVISFCLRRCDRVIAVSRYTAGLCLGMGVRESRCLTIPNGVNVNEHVPSPSDIQAAREWLNEKGVAPGRPMLITVGRLVKRKGIARFIGEIFPLLLSSRPHLLYIVAGEGGERRAIDAEITRLWMSGTVILAGRLPRPLLRGLMGISTSFVMPNIPVLGDAEGFGIVALEAGCGGLPVVASDLEGIRDAVSDGVNGFLAPSDNPLAFAGAVNRLLSNEGLRKEMGARAREYVAANFGWDTIAARYLEELRYISRNED